MKNKFVFIFMVILQLGVFLSMIANKEIIVRNGSTHKFQIVSRDPYDFMRGNYLSINLEQRELGRDYGSLKNKNGYFVVEKNGEFSRISEFYTEKAEADDYIKGKLGYSYDGKTYFENPFRRFYMEEKEAKKVEEKILKGSKAYIVVKIYKGSYAIESIEIE